MIWASGAEVINAAGTAAELGSAATAMAMAQSALRD
jgi:malate/lactate dehydrogenase